MASEPKTYTTEQARMRLRETLATAEYPQDGTAEEYFIRDAFPDPPVDGEAQEQVTPKLSTQCERGHHVLCEGNAGIRRHHPEPTQEAIEAGKRVLAERYPFILSRSGISPRTLAAHALVAATPLIRKQVLGEVDAFKPVLAAHLINLAPVDERFSLNEVEDAFDKMLATFRDDRADEADEDDGPPQTLQERCRILERNMHYFQAKAERLVSSLEEQRSKLSGDISTLIGALVWALDRLDPPDPEDEPGDHAAFLAAKSLIEPPPHCTDQVAGEGESDV